MADKKIVVAIDDSTEELMVLNNILSKLYDLRVCKSAVDGLKLLGTINVDIILLDIEMPEMSGFEFLHQIKKIPRLMATPVIVISGHSTEDFISHALSQGASEMLSKPVKSEVLLETVKELLEHPRKGGIFDL
ncbi:response regulator [Leadbettera azotonutricia]|uniref:Two-component hybrid protein n=1 Tax=Leadbettera azotonutricia (strain ATCC BAA-888 / DSM 13862 / ZAS-9) TaxID=545695 RepID=F5Y7Z8_LEAAZ|nr:response regulator [Leadbettera azotonutricia]AEF83369.1 two-component hybrid protein [Leadbettera azotonutricia ZAS-9]